MGEAFKIFLGLELLFILFAFQSEYVIQANSTNNSNWTVCLPRDQEASCQCPSDVIINVIVRCQLTRLVELDAVIQAPHKVVRLNLSGNHITKLFNGSFFNFTEMIFLSLASNGIQTINQGAFHGLTKLLEIDLNDNNILNWDTSLIKQDLPELRLINAEGNINWKPNRHIFSLPRIQAISLLFTKYSKTKPSLRCFVVRKNNSFVNTQSYNSYVKKLPGNIEKPVEPNQLLKREECFMFRLIFRSSGFLDAVYDNGFYFHCEFHRPSKSKNNFTKAGTKTDWFYFIEVYCWNLKGLIQIGTTSFGILSLFFNLLVIITTLKSRVLRESVAHVLVANIAVGDLLVSFYLIIITTTRQSLSRSDFRGLYMYRFPFYCTIVGLLLILGQFSSMLMSFVMTLERYLAVVYCMRPHIRITMRICYVSVVTLWSLMLSLAVSFMTSEHFSTNTDNMCVPSTNMKDENVLLYVGSIGILLYFISIALYVHMYLDFKRTNQKTAQLQRENSLARRIALIMFTNVAFLLLPLIATSALAVPPFKHYVSNRNKSIIWDTFAVTCLGINSCLNPLLFSFRNEKFRSQFRKRILQRNNSVDIGP